jgi:hypothetical protein
MSRAVPERARGLAAELERRFARDAELATELSDAQRRLQHANDRLWSGLDPDGIAAIYGEHPAAAEAAAAHNRSEVLDAPVPLRAVQQVHWSIHRAFTSYQSAAERRRHLAAEIGELASDLITTLLGAGWSEHDAREARVDDLAIARTCAGQSPVGPMDAGRAEARVAHTLVRDSRRAACEPRRASRAAHAAGRAKVGRPSPLSS